MDITKAIEGLKKEPEFAENVGMVLAHNGVVRGWSREDRQPVTGVNVSADGEKIEALRRQYSKKPGIYKILVDYKTGKLKPGDDLLFIVVAGDIRENVKPVLSDLLDAIKSQAISKTESR